MGLGMMLELEMGIPSATTLHIQSGVHHSRRKQEMASGGRSVYHWWHKYPGIRGVEQKESEDEGNDEVRGKNRRRVR